MEFREFETERLLLRIMRPELVGQEYLSWFKEDVTNAYITYAKANVTLEGLKKYAEEKWQSPDSIFFGIFDKKNHLHIGNIKFEPINFQQKSAILGVLIGNKDWRGKGVFTEVLEGLSQGLKDGGISKVYLGVDLANHAAIKAYEKSGFSMDEKNYSQVDLSKYCSMVKELN